MMRILITGVAGFIGYHFTKRLLLNSQYHILGIDNLNSYYDVNLKHARLTDLKSSGWENFEKADLAESSKIIQIFDTFKPDVVVNLAAQAGVRYSLTNPQAYNESNLSGFLNILEGCRHQQVKHLIFASSSSVYGANRKLPYSEADNVDHPVSLYAATKKAGELMAHSYSHLYGLPCTGLRFFTVYGPWGRPDMAYYKFTDSILKGEPIEVFNNGNMRRDFTYIDDIVESIERLLKLIPYGDDKWDGMAPKPETSMSPYRIYNIGNNNPEKLTDLIFYLEKELGVSANKKFLPMQAGDVYETYADTSDLYKAVGFKPYTSLEDGLKKFISWYKLFHGYHINEQSRVTKTVRA